MISSLLSALGLILISGAIIIACLLIIVILIASFKVTIKMIKGEK